MRYFENIEKRHIEPEELKVFVKKAQQQDATAIERLCGAYEGLIRKLCNSSYVLAYLEYEDAVNSCYVFFLEIILNYKGPHYDKLPGLIELYVSGRLNRMIFYERRYSGQTTSYDAFTELDDSLLADTTNPPDKLMKLMVEELLQLFEPQDRLILQLYYVDGLSVREISERLGLTFTQVRYRLDLAKKRFKEV